MGYKGARQALKGCRTLGSFPIIGILALGLFACTQDVNLDDPATIAAATDQLKQSLRAELHQCADVEPLSKTKNIPDGTHRIDVTDVSNLNQGYVPLMIDETGDAYIYAIVDGVVRVKFLVDTGASITNIPREMIHRLGCEGVITAKDILDPMLIRFGDGEQKILPVVSVTLTIIEHSLANGKELIETLRNIHATTYPTSPYLLGRNLVLSVDLANRRLNPIAPGHCMLPIPFWNEKTHNCVASDPVEIPMPRLLD